MIGFMKKDISLIKRNFKSLGIIIIFYLILGYYSDFDISFLLPFISVMLMISTFSYDSFNKWDVYASTIANGRKNGVRSKYLTTILIALIGTIFTILISFLFSYLKHEPIVYQEFIPTIIGTLMSCLFIQTIMYPIIYKFGVEKARIIIFGLVFSIIIGGSFLIKYLSNTEILNNLSFLYNYWLLILILGSLIFMILSYIISIRIALKKEL